MFLSQLSNKQIFLDKTPRGFCLGIGISPKSKTVKYLFCTTEENDDFVLPIDALFQISDNGLHLSRLRPILPKPCAKLFPRLPIYAFDGKFSGYLMDVECINGIAVQLLTDRGERYPFSAISVVSDAILLRKPQPYPIGQPTTFEHEGIVTRALLRKAIQEQSLIRLTLSLPPFHHALR